VTIGGFIVRGPDSAFLWADCETYDEDDPKGQVNKIALSAFPCIAGTGCGVLWMISESAAELQHVLSIDGAIRKLPRMLKPYAAPGRFFGIIGRSVRYGRMIGVRFVGALGFEPQVCGAAAWPEIELNGFAISERRDLIEPALRQMTARRREPGRRHWSGGGLIVAEITRHGLAAQRFPEFGAMALAIDPLAPTAWSPGSAERSSGDAAEPESVETEPCRLRVVAA